MSLPDDLARAASELAAGPLAAELQWHASVPSTMDLAARAAAAGAAAGLLVVADEQTEGRGRRGRAWVSPPGAGLYCSLVLRPGPDATVSLITLAAGVGVFEGLARASGLRAELKWPNDVMLDCRKLAGILAEGHGFGGPAPAVVLGVGINLLPAAYPPEVAARATSLEAELGRAVDRGSVLVEVVRGIRARAADLDRGRAGDILRAWRAAAPSAHGRLVEWDAAGGPRRGTTAGVDEAGALLVTTDAGTERIVAGEVRWA